MNRFGNGSGPPDGPGRGRQGGFIFSFGISPERGGRLPIVLGPEFLLGVAEDFPSALVNLVDSNNIISESSGRVGPRISAGHGGAPPVSLDHRGRSGLINSSGNSAGLGYSWSIPLVPNNTEYCRTESQIAKKQFVWTLEQFSRCFRKNGESLSEIFKASDVDGRKQEWRLRIHRCGVDNEEGLTIFVEFNPSDKKLPSIFATQVFANLQIAIKNSKGEEAFKKNLFIDTKKYGKELYAFSSFLKRDILFNPENGLLPEDKLTIICNIENIKEKILSYTLPEIIVPEGQMMAEIGALLENMHHSDCTIISADNKELKVHKCILASRSPVFAAMFEHGTIESQNNTITIPDFDSKVLKQMLQYIYNENAVDCINNAEKVLAVADKYGLERLKVLCGRELANSMNVENACQLLILATLHSAKQLESYAIEYIKKHEKQVKASKGWGMLSEEHFRLLFV